MCEERHTWSIMYIQHMLNTRKDFGIISHYAEKILGCLEREFSKEHWENKKHTSLEMKPIFKAFTSSNSSKYSNCREKLGLKPMFGWVELSCN